MLPSSRWQAFAYPNFRRFILGQFASSSGGWALRVTQSWLVLELGGSPAMLGLVVVLQTLPVTLFTLFAGVLLDRLEPRRILQVAQVGLAVQAALLATLVLTNQVQLWEIPALALLTGVFGAAEIPARSTSVGQLVPPDALGTAVSLTALVQNGARIFGPGLVGLVIDWWGIGPAFALTSAAYVMGSTSLLTLDRRSFVPIRRAGRGRVLVQLAQGLDYARRTPPLFSGLLLLAFIGTFGFNFGTVLPLMAHNALGASAEAFGLMNAAMGFGSVVGAFLVSRQATPSFRLVLVAAAAMAVLLAVVGMVPYYPLILGPLVLLGMAALAYSTATNARLQMQAREEYRGRILGLYTLLIVGSSPIGGALVGLTADRGGIRTTMLLQAAVCALGIALVVAMRRGWLRLLAPTRVGDGTADSPVSVGEPAPRETT